MQMDRDTIGYPLTAAQHILFYNQKFTFHKEVNNIFTLLLVENELDLPALKVAVELAYLHNDAMHIRLFRQNGEIRQCFHPKKTPVIGSLDFTGMTQEQMDKRLYRLASKPFYILNHPMSRIWVVRSCNGMTGLYFGVSHIVLDSWGICVMLKYVMDLYNAIKGSTEMPKQLYKHETLLAQDVAYRNTPQYNKDLDFWKQECTRDEPWYTHINGPSVLATYCRKKHNQNLQGSSGFSLRSKAKHEVLLIPRETAEAMESYCAEHRMPVQALVMLAFRTCLSKRNARQKDVSFYATVARRSTLQEKQSGGTRVHPFPFRTIIEERCSFVEALEQVHNRQCLLYRHAGIDMLEVLKLMEDTYHKGDPMASYESACLTFQPVKLTLSSGMSCHTKWYCNGATSQSFYLTIMDDDGSGALRCYYEYRKATVEQQTVLNFHDDLLAIIRSALINDKVTIGELLNS